MNSIIMKQIGDLAEEFRLAAYDAAQIGDDLTAAECRQAHKELSDCLDRLDDKTHKDGSPFYDAKAESVVHRIVGQRLGEDEGDAAAPPHEATAKEKRKI